MPKAKTKATEPRDNAIERDPKFGVFARLYVSGGDGFKPGNTLKAAKAAGYDDTYARHHGHLLLARLKLRAGPVLKGIGIDEFTVARKIKQLMAAKSLKYHPGTKKMLTMANGQVQLGATQAAIKILGMEAPTVLRGEGPGGSIVLRTSVASPKR